ncbi:MAG: DnaD domain protein [Clostridia bacterium]|nr:DnaD domain protein [Clostridia bacterium]
MEKEKKGFVMYLDYEEHFKLLSDDELGQLLRIIYEFERTGKIPVIENKTIAMAFSFIGSQLERDNQKYEETIKKRKAAGTKGADCRWNLNNTRELTGAKTDMAKMANAKFAMAKNSKRTNNIAKMADTETDTDKDKDKDKDIHSEEIIADDVAVKEILNYLTKDGQPRPPAAVLQPLFEFNLPVPLIIAAFNTAAFRGHNTLDYVCGILRGWKEKGFKTLEEVKNEQKILVNAGRRNGKEKAIKSFEFEHDWDEEAFKEMYDN